MFGSECFWTLETSNRIFYSQKPVFHHKPTLWVECAIKRKMLFYYLFVIFEMSFFLLRLLLHPGSLIPNPSGRCDRRHLSRGSLLSWGQFRQAAVPYRDIPECHPAGRGDGLCALSSRNVLWRGRVGRARWLVCWRLLLPGGSEHLNATSLQVSHL